MLATCHHLLEGIRPTLEAFMEESRRMDNIGHILDPTLFNSPERRATEALLKPVFKAGLDFLRTYDVQAAVGRDALEKVKADG